MLKGIPLCLFLVKWKIFVAEPESKWTKRQILDCRKIVPEYINQIERIEEIKKKIGLSKNKHRWFSSDKCWFTEGTKKMNDKTIY